MTSRLRLALVSALATAGMSLALVGCSIEQTTDRCASDSMTLDGLIKCVREKHGGAPSCQTAGRGPTAVPVTGRRLLKYGETTKHGGTSRGIVFEGTRGGEVRAPIGGRVTYADPWRSYGDLLIIESCTTVALIAGELSPEVIAGQSIAAGKTVATLRQTASDAPVLYLEVRENDATVDPAGVIPAE